MPSPNGSRFRRTAEENKSDGKKRKRCKGKPLANGLGRKQLAKGTGSRGGNGGWEMGSVLPIRMYENSGDSSKFTYRA